MRFIQQIAVLVMLGAAASAVAAGTNGEEWQLVTVPGNSLAARFVDIDNDGRMDLLAVDDPGKKLLIYRQRAWGFTNAPDQAISVPEKTAWTALHDVDSHPGAELLFSTATGVCFYRQNGGVFETESQALVRVDQVFMNDDLFRLVSLATNAAIPVISATNVVFYERSGAFEWQPGRSAVLQSRKTSWSSERGDWTMGANSSRNLRVTQSLRANPIIGEEDELENEAIQKLVAEMKKAGPGHRPGISREDVDGDGRKDFVVWQTVGDMDSKTDVYVFLRGPDDKLPERPTQSLHCHGFPIPVNSTHLVSPVADLKGDGTHQLVLLETKTSITSASGFVEMALSRGVEFALTIRSFNHGAFSRSPDATAPAKAILSMDALEAWPFFVFGDFNGDGRPDLVVQRTATQWNVILSTNDNRWFAPEPAITFETPMRGYMEVDDISGDGRADIVLAAKDDPRIYIRLSQTNRMKGTP